MTKRLIGIAAITVLGIAASGCVSTSDVVPMGKDSYAVTATSHGALGGEGTEFSEAAKSANQYCEKLGKHMIPRNTDSRISGFGQIGATTTFVFSCVSETDPEYKRPVLNQDSKIVH